MNQRVPVDVTESIAFRNACGMRFFGDDRCDGADLKLEDVLHYQSEIVTSLNYA